MRINWPVSLSTARDSVKFYTDISAQEVLVQTNERAEENGNVKSRIMRNQSSRPL